MTTPSGPTVAAVICARRPGPGVPGAHSAPALIVVLVVDPAGTEVDVDVVVMVVVDEVDEGGVPLAGRHVKRTTSRSTRPAMRARTHTSSVPGRDAPCRRRVGTTTLATGPHWPA